MYIFSPVNFSSYSSNEHCFQKVIHWSSYICDTLQGLRIKRTIVSLKDSSVKRFDGSVVECSAVTNSISWYMICFFLLLKVNKKKSSIYKFNTSLLI